MPELIATPTGLPDLDACLGGGLRPGQLIVIAGYPSHGASITATGFARCTAANKHGAVIVALESTADDTTRRVLSANAKVPLHHMLAGAMTDEEWERLQAAVTQLAEQDLVVTHSARSLNLIEDAIAEQAPNLLVVDGAHLLTPDHDYGGQAQFADDDARRLKLLAVENDMAVVVTLPLETSGSHHRINGRPLMRDFGKRQAYAQVADTVILTWRPDVGEYEDPRAGEIDLIVAKNRNGSAPTITAAFQGHYARLMAFSKELPPIPPPAPEQP